MKKQYHFNTQFHLKKERIIIYSNKNECYINGFQY